MRFSLLQYEYLRAARRVTARQSSRAGIIGTTQCKGAHHEKRTKSFLNQTHCVAWSLGGRAGKRREQRSRARRRAERLRAENSVPEGAAGDAWSSDAARDRRPAWEGRRATGTDSARGAGWVSAAGWATETLTEGCGGGEEHRGGGPEELQGQRAGLELPRPLGEALGRRGRAGDVSAQPRPGGVRGGAGGSQRTAKPYGSASFAPVPAAALPRERA